jgi:hypothetical protein
MTGSPLGFPKRLPMFTTGFLAGREMMEPKPQRQTNAGRSGATLGQGDADVLSFVSPLRSTLSRVADGGVTVTGDNVYQAKQQGIL